MDVQAGVIGSLAVLAVVLTLGLLAFAPLGAAAPSTGLNAAFITAVIGGLIYALAGRSAMPASGPSSATALILAALVLELATATGSAGGTRVSVVVAGCALAVAASGLLQVLVARLGFARLCRLVPRPVLAGFMNGVALLILIGQLPLALGLMPGATVGWSALASSHAGPLLLAGGTVLLLVLLRRRWPRAPAALIALAVGCIAALALPTVWPGLTVGPHLGMAPPDWTNLAAAAAWFRPTERAVLLDHGLSIAVTATVLALIGGLESVLNLMAVDQALESHHDARHELQTMGLCNIVCGLLGGLPVVALRARAIAILQAGGHGRLAAGIGSAALGLLYTVGTPLLDWLPLPVLGGIMVLVAFDLIDRWTFRLLMRWLRGESAADLRTGLWVMALVCTVTVWKGFAAGVAVGVLLSMTIFIARMNRSLLRTRVTAQARPSRRVYPPAIESLLQPLRVHIEVWELEAALFFGNADRLVHLAEGLPGSVRALVLDLRRVTSIDETGVAALVQLDMRLQRRHLLLQLTGLTEGGAPARALAAHGLARLCMPDTDRAIENAEAHVLGAAAEATLTGRPLSECGLLQGLDNDQMRTVQGLMTPRQLSAGEAVFRQGDAGDGLFVLTQGSVSVISRQGTQTQRYLSLSPGMMLGETALLDGGTRSADAVADTPAQLHHLSRGALQTLEREHPAIALRLHANMAAYLSQRLRAASAAWWASQH
jgi:sulfate permease, SulP family